MPPPASGLPPMRVAAQLQLEVFVEGMCTDVSYPEDSERTLLEQWLDESCSSCHSDPPGGTPLGGLGRVNDIVALIADGHLVPCRSDASPLVQAIASGSMPPAGLPPGSAGQLDALRRFIDSPCAR